jgi:hypothetical protein
MRVVRGSVIALFTAFAGCILAVFVGPTGFVIAQGWSFFIVCGIAGLLGGVPYLLSDKPPQIDGKHLELEFELRAPATLKIPE